MTYKCLGINYHIRCGKNIVNHNYYIKCYENAFETANNTTIYLIDS